MLFVYFVYIRLPRPWLPTPFLSPVVAAHRAAVPAVQARVRIRYRWYHSDISSPMKEGLRAGFEKRAHTPPPQKEKNAKYLSFFVPVCCVKSNILISED
jgi:hypothetical protein